MSQITLIDFKGCPNAEKARWFLQELGVEFEEFDQTKLSLDDPRRYFSSPSLFRDGALIYGAIATGGEYSVESLDVERLKRTVLS